MEFKPDSLEHFIFYASYAKAALINLKQHMESFSTRGCLDDAEQALLDSLLIGFTKLDDEYEQIIRECLARTDKGDHILYALMQLLKKDEGKDAN